MVVAGVVYDGEELFERLPISEFDRCDYKV